MTRLKGLDGLRGLAIALVVSYHAFGAPRGGQLSVDLFFVLSGFLITKVLIDGRQRTGRISLRAFYGRRVRRVLPALFAMLLAVTPSVAHQAGVAKGLLWSAAGLAFSANLVMAHASSFAAPLTPLWSLAQEEQFYLVWPPIVVLLASRRRILVGLLATGLAATTLRQIQLVHDGAPTSRILYAPDTRSMGILVGCLTALVLASRHADALVKLARVIAWPAAAMLVGLPFAEHGNELFLGGMLIFTISCAVVVVRSLDTASGAARMFGIAPLAYLGRISYSLYLWHLPVLILFGRGHQFWAELLGVAVAVPVAAVSYRYIEQPFLQRRDRVRAPGLQAAPAQLAFEQASLGSAG